MLIRKHHGVMGRYLTEHKHSSPFTCEMRWSWSFNHTLWSRDGASLGGEEPAWLTGRDWPTRGQRNRGSPTLEYQTLTWVSELASKQNLCRTWSSVSLTTSSPSRTPRQLLGPAPKGRYVKGLCWSRASAVNLRVRGRLQSAWNTCSI